MLVAAFLSSVILDGIIFSFGVFKLEVVRYFDSNLGTVASTGAVLVAACDMSGIPRLT